MTRSPSSRWVFADDENPIRGVGMFDDDEFETEGRYLAQWLKEKNVNKQERFNDA